MYGIVLFYCVHTDTDVQLPTQDIARLKGSVVGIFKIANGYRERWADS